MSENLEKYQPTQDEVQAAEGMMTEYKKEESQAREKLLSQTPEEARGVITKTLNERYNDRARGVMVEGFKEELRLIQEAIPELEALGYEVKVSSTGLDGALGGTNVLLKLGGHVIELACQFYDTYSDATESELKADINAMLGKTREKIEMAKWFGKIYQEEKRG